MVVKAIDQKCQNFTKNSHTSQGNRKSLTDLHWNHLEVSNDMTICNLDIIYKRLNTSAFIKELRIEEDGSSEKNM